EPRLERKALDGTAARGLRVAVKLWDQTVDGVGECLRRRRLVSLPALWMRHTGSRLVADELDRTSALRIDDRQPARHRLDHEARTRIKDFGVYEEVRTPEKRGCLALRVGTRELNSAV